MDDSDASSLAAFRLARRGLAALETHATETTHRTRFPANATLLGLEMSPFPGDLYDGAAGVAAVLLEAAPLDPSGRVRRLGRTVLHGVLASTHPAPRAEETGLYLGTAGSAVTIARWGIADGDGARVEEGLRLLSLAGARLPHLSDVLGGVAGVGLAAVALHEATGDPAARDIVRTCTSVLAERARPWAGGIAWPVGQDAQDGHVGKDDLQTGFAHGLAGVAAFLARAAALVPEAVELERAAFAALRALARERDGALAWPVSDRRETERHHWCHGSTGIAHAFLARHAVAGDAESLRMAAGAAEHAWRALVGRGRRPQDRTVGHCHGLAGALEVFTLIGRATGASLWRDRAGAVVRTIARRAPGRGPSGLDADGFGVAYGTSGVIRALLPVAGGTVWQPWGPLPEGRLHSRAAPIALRPLPSPARPVRARAPLGMRLSGVVPRAAGAVVGSSHALPLDERYDDDLARHAEAALAGPAGGEFRSLLRTVDAHGRALADRHAAWLRPGALGEAVVGSFLRECAGILLRPSAAPLAQRRRVVRHMVARHFRGLARCLDQVAHDACGVLAPFASDGVVRVAHLGGDPHRGEAGVFALTFGDGREIVHKPRSVRLDAFIAGADAESAASLVMERLPVTVPGARLARHRITPAGPWHGYAERIVTHCVPLPESDAALRFVHDQFGTPSPIEGARLEPGDEPRFWLSAGLLAAHAACLGIADLHGENMVAGTSEVTPRISLHAVDLEMAFLAEGSVAGANLTPEFGHPVAPPEHMHWGLDVKHGGLCTMGAEMWCTLITPEGPIATRRPAQLAGRRISNMVRNGDGTLGCGPFLPALLRGFADYWQAMRPVLPALAQRAHRALQGEVVRILAKTSRAYMGALLARTLGEPLWSGATAYDAHTTPEAFTPEEVAQLDAFDIPYFFARLGKPGTRWIDGGVERVTDLATKTVLADPFWSVIEKFGDPDALAYGVADLATFGAPPGAFDLRDDRLGVRVRRTADDPRIAIAIALEDGVVRFRLEPDGRVRRWEA